MSNVQFVDEETATESVRVQVTIAKLGVETDSSQQAAIPHELRIGVAMSGAIALVLYEAGVAHEIVRFAQALDNAQGSYFDALTTAEIRPVVDILAGASAGGINSVLMASCLASGQPFDRFRNPWIKSASVDTLRYKFGQSPQSLLNPQKLLDDILPTLRVNSEIAAKRQPYERPDLDVRLCRTDIMGHSERMRDAMGQDIYVESKWNTVCFRGNHFADPNPAQISALLGAAQATSAFPVVFPPVVADDTGARTLYTDGGLWDNQPIDHAVAAVRDKPAIGVTDRCIIFSEPEPQTAATPTQPVNPDLFAILGQLPFMGVKGNMWPSLCSILDFNRRSQGYQALVKELGENSMEGVSIIARNLWEESQQQFADVSGGSVLKAPLSVLNEVRLATVLFEGDAALYSRWQYVLSIASSEISTQMQTAVIRCLDKLHDADLKRREWRRRIDAINEQLRDPKSGASTDPATPIRKAELYSLLSVVNAQLAQVDESVLQAYTQGSAKTRLRIAAEKMLGALEGASQSSSPVQISPILDNWIASVPVIDATEASVPTQIGDALEMHNMSSAEHQVSAAINQELAAKSVYQPDDIDVLRYVIADMSDLIGKKKIDLIRVSPEDAKSNYTLTGMNLDPYATAASQKLAGEGLGHLTGFLQERWRRNDYVWGRLDASEVLLRTLRKYVNADKCASFDAQVESWIETSRTEILRDEAAYFLNTDNRRQIEKFVKETDYGASDSTCDRSEANRRLIGYGQETIVDADQPQLTDNIHYLVSQAAKLLAGKPFVPTSALSMLERLARFVSVIVWLLCKLFPWPVAGQTAPSSRSLTRQVVLLLVGVVAGGIGGWLISSHEFLPKNQPTVQSWGKHLIEIVVLLFAGCLLGSRVVYGVIAAILVIFAVVESFARFSSVMQWQTLTIAVIGAFILVLTLLPLINKRYRL
ncbi:MAG TPA: DUF3376 domain-containing protein [Capsulimonadaceae bacterium]|jgi:predicted acylesterase/phospholipase RssA